MIRKILKNRKGVTLLEGLIALVLLAMVTTGTFAVLLSTSRRSAQPDIREEMTFAVERAMNKLQTYVFTTKDDSGDKIKLSTVPTAIQNGLCGTDEDPLAAGSHNIDCMLPPICNNNSSFKYTVSVVNSTSKLGIYRLSLYDIGSASGLSLAEPYSINFDITCNGYKL